MPYDYYHQTIPLGPIGSMAQMGCEEFYHEDHDVFDPADEYEEKEMSNEETLKLLRQLYQDGHIDIWTFWSWADAFGL